MANGGSLQGTQIFSQSTVDSFHSEPTEGDMIITVNSMTKGGVELFKTPSVVKPTPPKLQPPKGMEGSYGWYGFGGSVFYWHPEMKIGFAFVPTFMHIFDVNNVRGKNLLAEAIRCAELKASAAEE